MVQKQRLENGSNRAPAKGLKFSTRKGAQIQRNKMGPKQLQKRGSNTALKKGGSNTAPEKGLKYST